MHIVFDANVTSPALPLFVLIECDNYVGPALTDSQPGCVPICHVCMRNETGVKEWVQIQLQLAWAVSVHRGQGMTLDKVLPINPELCATVIN